tara:strand:- start:2688 stop:3839 length:1152 start_codon:yes stop_codon:yes gene_type:complete
MKKIVCYWSPFISEVATVKAVINSAISVNKYSNHKFEALIIDAFGEWRKKFTHEHNDLKFHCLNNISTLFKFSSEGFLKSRLKYLLIFLFSFISLKKFLIKKKPEFLIIHLITSLPLLINLIYKLDTKLILRISGKPKMNFVRYVFWKLALKKIFKITFPTLESLNYFKSLKIINDDKIELLYDPVISIKDIKDKKKESLTNFDFKKGDFFVAIGRLTKQKNFVFLIRCFNKIIKKDPNIKLIIIGVGEEKSKIKNMIKSYNLNDNIKLIGYQKNVFKFLKNSKAFILSSLWEDPGFVLIEAMASDCLVLSSDCPNGPKEILEQKNGLLFKNNSETDFILKFNNLIKFSDLEKKRLKFNAKNKIKKYSIFYHYKKLQEILMYK